ncbi:thymidylate synthase [Vibrio phage qdvp001]|uniref:thymidylate synthase n=1 Tax=Vibrio phage qdvp001 TaxID=1003177 RepID=UPI0007204A78|nr:thymidylate synthase [Vibrio phage qdvp001]ALM62061.1 thymidyate synthase [Vibrio phage qdvp001]
MLSYEHQYLDLSRKILEEGEYTEDRTGTGVYSTIGGLIRHDLSKGFPLLTSKKINFNLIAGEMLWMLSGSNNLKDLRKYQCKEEDSRTIWTDDFEKYWNCLDEQGEDLLCQRVNQTGGRIYGKQWREFYSCGKDGYPFRHDQIAELIKNIKAVRDGDYRQARRLIVSAWHPYDHTEGEKQVAALSACHDNFQCIVRNGKLSLRYHLRSNDHFLGAPFNAGFYALLCHCLAQICELEVGELIYMGTDIHIYSTHIEQVKLQLSRDPKNPPKLIMSKFNTLEELLMLTGKDFKLEGYEPHGFIKAPQAS